MGSPPAWYDRPVQPVGGEPERVYITQNLRNAWAALDRKTHRAIATAGRRNQPWPDPDEAVVALGWAWAVLGPPQARRKVGRTSKVLYCLMYLVFGLRPQGMAAYDALAGNPRDDDSPTIRWYAKKVEQANLGVLERCDA